MNCVASNIKNKPDFLIIGAAKCGTTTLYDDLSQLDRLYMPSDKEPSILTKCQDSEGMRQDYRIHFSGARPDQLCGEGSTNYTKRPEFEGVAEKAYQLCGKDLKLIMIMRDPVERIYSHLRHNIAARRILPADIDKTVLSDPAYITMSDYVMQLRPWINTFGAQKIYCLSLSEYRQARAPTVSKIANFLGISAEALSLDSDSISNKSSKLRYTGKRMGRLLASPFYRRFLRPLLPDVTRAWSRNVLLPKVHMPVIKLSEAVEQELWKRFENLEHDIEALIGRQITLNEK